MTSYIVIVGSTNEVNGHTERQYGVTSSVTFGFMGRKCF